MYTVKCEVCRKPLESEYWDDIEAHLEGCYAKRPPRWRGKLEALSEEALNAPCTTPCEIEAFPSGFPSGEIIRI